MFAFRGQGTNSPDRSMLSSTKRKISSYHRRVALPSSQVRSTWVFLWKQSITGSECVFSVHLMANLTVCLVSDLSCSMWIFKDQFHLLIRLRVRHNNQLTKLSSLVIGNYVAGTANNVAPPIVVCGHQASLQQNQEIYEEVQTLATAWDHRLILANIMQGNGTVMLRYVVAPWWLWSWWWSWRRDWVQ